MYGFFAALKEAYASAGGEANTVTNQTGDANVAFSTAGYDAFAVRKQVTEAFKLKAGNPGITINPESHITVEGIEEIKFDDISV